MMQLKEMTVTITKRYFECQCNSDEHRLVFTLDDDDDGPEIYASVFLADWPGVLGRLKDAITYVLGHKSKYGHFDTFIMCPDDVREMHGLIDRYLELRSAGTKDKEKFAAFWDAPAQGGKEA